MNERIQAIHEQIKHNREKTQLEKAKLEEINKHLELVRQHKERLLKETNTQEPLIQQQKGDAGKKPKRSFWKGLLNAFMTPFRWLADKITSNISRWNGEPEDFSNEVLDRQHGHHDEEGVREAQERERAQYEKVREAQERTQKAKQQTSIGEHQQQIPGEQKIATSEGGEENQQPAVNPGMPSENGGQDTVMQRIEMIDKQMALLEAKLAEIEKNLSTLDTQYRELHTALVEVLDEQKLSGEHEKLVAEVAHKEDALGQNRHGGEEGDTIILG